MSSSQFRYRPKLEKIGPRVNAWYCRSIDLRLDLNSEDKSIVAFRISSPS
jgi:hypothetical protein